MPPPPPPPPQPQAFIDRLTAYKRSLEENELKEKQLAALRVDTCSTEAFKRLKGLFGFFPVGILPSCFKALTRHTRSTS